MIPSISDLRGGPTFVLRKMAIGLTGAGVENVVACTDDDGPTRKMPDLKWATDTGIRVFVFPRQMRFYSFSGGMARWLLKNVESFDVVHVHSIFNFPSAAACLIARLRKRPYIVHTLGILSQWGFANRRSMLKPLSFRLLEKRLLLRAHAVHVTSELERKAVDYYLQRSPKSPANDFKTRIIVIPEPSELAADGEWSNVRANTQTVLFMSRVDPKKGFDILFAAFSRVRQRVPSARLLVVGPGDPDYIESLKKQVAALALDEFVTWRGFAGGAEKWETLRSGAVLVLPSHAENFAVIVLEALSVGTPVVISDNVGLADAIKEANAGIVTTMKPDDVAEGIISLLTDDALCDRVRTNGRALINRCFRENLVIEKLKDMYEAAVSP